MPVPRHPSYRQRCDAREAARRRSNLVALIGDVLIAAGGCAAFVLIIAVTFAAAAKGIPA